MEAFGAKEDKAFDAHMLKVARVGPYFWDRFAERMFMSHDRAKCLAYRVMYGVETDPWVLQIVNTELQDLMFR